MSFPAGHLKDVTAVTTKVTARVAVMTKGYDLSPMLFYMSEMS